MTLLALPAWALLGAADAADHAEAPGTAADPAADIADVYAFVTEDRFAAILTFAGLTPAGAPGTYDADVLYTVHIDRDGDLVSDASVTVRFGQNGAGAWGVQASGIPGASTLEGAVEAEVADGGHRLWAGPRDDPFFFDLAGYQDTLATGSVSFDSTRDSLAGTNVTAIIFEGPAADYLGGATDIAIWATTGRK